MGVQDELYLLADELRAIANAGLRWAENGYDRERCERILGVSARVVAALEHSPFETVLSQYRDNLGHLTPLMCVEAVVLRESKMLLIRRSDDGKWALPGGMMEVGESPAEGAARELWEEAGLRGQAERLLALYDSRHWPSSGSRMQLCIAQFLMDAPGQPALHTEGQSERSSMAEALDVGFFGEHELPELHRSHAWRVPKAFRLARGEENGLYFDP